MKLDELQDNIRQSIPHIPLEITAVCVYGSYARDEANKDSDLDLLIIADNIASRRIDRAKDIIRIKDALALKMPVDIMLLTKNECISNFRNHNPLFLDITVEGVVIFDSNDFLKVLIQETADYIKTRPLIKEKYGWRFPVIDRMPTYLSKLSNKDFAEGMFMDAQRDIIVAKSIIDSGIYDKAVYHCQQAVEKAVKSILISFGRFQKIHFVGSILAEEIEAHNLEDDLKRGLKDIVDISAELEPEVTWSRYPSINGDALWLPYNEYSEVDAKNALDKAQKTVEITKEFLKRWFKG